MRDLFEPVIHGSVAEHELTVEPARNRRKRCRECRLKGVRRAASHIGCANGVAMTSGCEWHMQAWLRDTLAKRRAGAFRRLTDG